MKALVQDDKDLGRKQDLLPPFESPAGANRRAQLLSHADILDLIAEAEAEAAEDWLLWADTEAAQRFPRDMTLMARRLLHASFRGDTGLVRTLRTVLKSLPPAERRKPVILDALVRADFLLGQFEAGDAHLAELLALAPEHDVQRIVSARLRALVMAGRLSVALDLARASPRSTDPDLTLAICQTYQEAGATGELCAHVDRAGGIAALNEPATARFVEAVERGEHFLGGRFYRDMLARMKGQGIRRGLWSRTYQGAAQLVRMGLMTTTPEWERWKI